MFKQLLTTSFLIGTTFSYGQIKQNDTNPDRQQTTKQLLTDVADVAQALKDGYDVRRVLSYGDCDFYVNGTRYPTPLESTGYGEMIPFQIKKDSNDKVVFIESEKSPFVSIFDYDLRRLVYQYNYGRTQLLADSNVQIDVKTFYLLICP